MFSVFGFLYRAWGHCSC